MDYRISQSMAIMEYINDIKPEANLLPKDPKSRAKVNKIILNINQYVQRHSNTLKG
jgi:glutathione S-transferase